jgi:hypothetical protein
MTHPINLQTEKLIVILKKLTLFKKETQMPETQDNRQGFRPVCSDCGTKEECQKVSLMTPIERYNYFHGSLLVILSTSRWLRAPEWCTRGIPKY